MKQIERVIFNVPSTISCPASYHSSTMYNYSNITIYQVGTTEVPATGTSSVSRLAGAAGRRGPTTPATYIDTAALSTREEGKI